MAKTQPDMAIALLLMMSHASFLVGAEWQETDLSPLRSAQEVLELVDLQKNPAPMLFQIGEQKCGSTTLFKLLHQHPGVCKAMVLEGERPWADKELFFFGFKNKTKNLVSDFPHYLEHFSKCPSNQLRIDASPGYMPYAAVAPTIKKVYTKLGVDTSKLKFLVILRDPVMRTVSAFEHYQRQHWLHNGTTLDHLTNQGIQMYNKAVASLAGTGRHYTSEGFMVGRGVYASSLRHWFGYFDPSQFLVLTLEQLNRDTAGTMAAVQTFVGLEQKDLVLKQMNVGHYERPPVPEALVEFFDARNEELFKLKDEYPEAFFETEDNKFNFEN